MTWLFPLLLFSVPVYAVSVWACRRGNLLVTLVVLAAALAWVPGLDAKGTTWAASLVGLCLGNVIVLFARRRKGPR